MLSFSSKNLVGIDIGTYSIKVVHLGGALGARTIKAASCFRLPREAGQVLPAVPAFVAELLSTKKISAKAAAALFTSQSLIFRHIHLPPMPEKDLKEAVSWELRKESGMSAAEIVADYIPAVDGGKKEEGKLSLIAFAARRAEVERTISFFKEAGVELRVLDVIPSALLCAFDMSNDWEAGANYAMLDIGESRSTLAILKDRKLAFVREITIGGRDLTHSIANMLGKTEEEAEDIKTELRLDTPAENAAPGLRAVKPIIEGLSAELQRSFDYYHAQYREGVVTHLFISGGTARMKGLDAFMTGATGVASFTDNPFRKVRVPKGIDKTELGLIAPCMTLAAGMASRGVA